MSGDRLRIVMVIGQFAPIVGGAEVQAGRLAREVARRGHEVTLLTGRWDRRWPEREALDGYEVLRIGAARPWLGLPGLRRFSYRWFLCELRRHLTRLAETADVFHVHQALEPAVGAARVAVATGVPALAKLSGSGDVYDLDILRERSGRVALDDLRRGLSRLVAVSATSAQQAVAAGWPADEVTVIPNGVPPAPWVKERYDAARRLVCVGRCRPEKGLDDLLRAFAQLAPRRPDLTLDLVGGGPEQPRLEAEAASLGVAERVRFHGDVPDPWPALREADVFVLPSHSEGLSNALLEAMSAGLPCVVTAVGGNLDLVGDGATGLAVPPREPAALAEAVGRVLSDADLRERLGRAGRAGIAERFSIESVADRYESLYREVLGRGNT